MKEVSNKLASTDPRMSCSINAIGTTPFTPDRQRRDPHPRRNSSSGTPMTDVPSPSYRRSAIGPCRWATPGCASTSATRTVLPIVQTTFQTSIPRESATISTARTKYSDKDDEDGGRDIVWACEHLATTLARHGTKRLEDMIQ